MEMQSQMSSIRISETETHHFLPPVDFGDDHRILSPENLSPPPSPPPGISEISGLEKEKDEDHNRGVIRKMEVTDAITRDKTICPICKDEFKLGEIAGELGCEHYFCFECIHGWLNFNGNDSCPVCRRRFLSPETSRYARILNRWPLYSRRRRRGLLLRFANEETDSSPSQPLMNNDGEAGYDIALDELESGSGSTNS